LCVVSVSHMTRCTFNLASYQLIYLNIDIFSELVIAGVVFSKLN